MQRSVTVASIVNAAFFLAIRGNLGNIYGYALREAPFGNSRTGE